MPTLMKRPADSQRLASVAAGDLRVSYTLPASVSKTEADQVVIQAVIAANPDLNPSDIQIYYSPRFVEN